MAGCCGPKCSKVFVIFFNIFFWFSGCAFVALGVLLLYNPAYQQYFTMLTVGNFPPEILDYVAFSCIGLGGFILFVGFFGCCGALQDSKCMLGTYVFCLLLVFLVELGVALICLYCRFYFPSESGAFMRQRIVEDYGMENKHNEQFTSAMDYTQYEMECCGIDGPADYTHSRWVNRTIADYTKRQRLPGTCCKLDKTNEYNEDEPWKKPNIVDRQKCQSADTTGGGYMDENGSLNYHGCWNKLLAWYMLHNLILMGTSAGLALLQIAGVAFTICLIRNIGEEA